MSLIEFLSEFSFRRIVFGTLLIGLCSGAMGTFLYLRRQSMMSDVVGHAATPGVMGAFLFVSVTPWLNSLGIDARSMPVIILGALVTGALAMLLANVVARTTRIGIDATMSVMLSLFLGGGLILLQIIQNGVYPGKGGIDQLMFGNSATLTNLDVYTLAVSTVLILLCTALLWRPLNVQVFDPILARMVGIPRWQTFVVDVLLVLSLVMGVKAVGLILMIAFAVFPPAAARQWSKTALQMVVLSGLIGAFSAVVGTYLSISMGKVPTGPVIVLVLAAFVLVSLVASPKRQAVQS